MTMRLRRLRHCLLRLPDANGQPTMPNSAGATYRADVPRHSKATAGIK